jgi:hypothetical protein
MKGRLIFFLFGLFFITACGENWIKKPEGLIPEKKMVDMLVDMHIADAIFLNKVYDPLLKSKFKSEDFYYSVLKKYNIADTVFEKSFIYYSSFPKDFEKIYASALDKANQLQEEYKTKEPEPVDVGNQ